MRTRDCLKDVGKLFTYKKNSILAEFYWWNIKRKALRLARYTGLQHHIIPAGNKCIIVNNRWLKAYNKKARAKITVHKLIQQAYFSTPANGARVIK